MDEFKKFYLADLLSIFTNLVYDTCVNIGQFVDSLLIIFAAVNKMNRIYCKENNVKNQVMLTYWGHRIQSFEFYLSSVSPPSVFCSFFSITYLKIRNRKY